MSLSVRNSLLVIRNPFFEASLNPTLIRWDVLSLYNDSFYRGNIAVSAGRRTTSKRQERSCGVRRFSQGIYWIGREPVIMKDTDESPRALVPVGGRGYVGDGDQGTFRIIVGEPPAKLPITWRPRKSANTTQRRQLLSQSRTPRNWHQVVVPARIREVPA